MADYRAERPGLHALQKQVDSWIAEHESAKQEAELAQAAADAGDDGWTVVGAKKGRHKTTDAEGTTVVGGVAPAVAARKRAAAAPPVTHPDFYRFQKREKQRDEVLALRQKFEADKQRIAELRKQRAFKPL